MRSERRASCFAAAVSGVSKPFGVHGVFYRIAGRQAAAIDGPTAYTIPPYNESATLGPRDPRGVARTMSAALHAPVAIIDANDAGCNTLGVSDGIESGWVDRLFADNPLGQTDEQTPICGAPRRKRPWPARRSPAGAEAPPHHPGTAASDREPILTLSCPTAPASVYAVAGPSRRRRRSRTARSFGDPDEAGLSMRVHFADEADGTLDGWRAAFAPLAETVPDGAGASTTLRKPRRRILIAVPGGSIRLDDLLFRCRPARSPPRSLASRPPTADFEALPRIRRSLSPAARRRRGPMSATQARWAWWIRSGCELVVLARYMQVLAGRCATSPGARSTSTTVSCPRSRAHGRMRRPTRAA